MLKKIVLYIICTFMLFTLSTKVNAQATTIHKNWECVNEGNWNSFYWKVKRTVYPDKSGYYYYDVFFYSNSYLNTDANRDGKYDKAIVYITDLNVIMHEYNTDNRIYNKFNVPIQYVLVDWADKKVAYFYSYSPYCKFYINYISAAPYNYSAY